MGNKTIAMLLAIAACGGDEVPSCQEAITAYYDAGCAFIDLQTNTAYSLSESIQGCKDTLVAVPDRCQSKFDDYVVCLAAVSNDTQCVDCTREQDALFGCD